MMNNTLYFNFSKVWFGYINYFLKVYNIIMGVDNNNEYKSFYIDGDRCSEWR